MNEEYIRQLEERIKTLEAKVESFTTTPSLSNDIQRALLLSLVTTSSKSASSENRSVNESGTNTYSVLNPPDRFIRIGDDNIPAYD